MKRNFGNAIRKGSMILTAGMILAGGGITKESTYPVHAEEKATAVEYAIYGTFSIDASPEAAKEGEVLEEEEKDLTLGDRFSMFGSENGLSGRPGRIPSGTGEQETERTETPAQTDGTTSTVQKRYKTADVTDASIGRTVARAYVPLDYTAEGEVIWCGKWQSLGAPAQVYLTALSPDQNTVLGYYSLVCYEEIVEYSQNGYSLQEHQDGVFDSSSMTPMLHFMTADTYCDYLAQTILPGQQLKFCGQQETTEKTKKQLDAKADELYQQACQLAQASNYNVAGTYAGIVQRNYNVTLDGYPFTLVVTAAVDGAQMSFSGELAYNMGTVNHSFISWESPCVFFMLTPESEYEAQKDVYEQFLLNTTVSDQFTQALLSFRNQLTQERIQQISGSMETLTGTCQSGMSSSMGEEDTYTAEEQFSDYLFDQNDYTLSNGDHIKVPTSYEYVYEGDDGNIYVSDSSFDQPGGSVQLYPNE